MGKIAVILGNGDFPRKEYPLYLLGAADYVVCCDGAFGAYLRWMKRSGSDRLPNAVVGDLDSAPVALRKKYGHLMVHITEQDDNDQTKTFNHVLDNYPDVSEIVFLGGTGKREDHTLGNMSLLMEYARTREEVTSGEVKIQMISDYSTIFPITDSIDIDCGIGRRISLFSPDNSLKISSEGLEWPTDEVVFDNWWKATLNRATADTVRLKFSHPSIALIVMD